MRRALSRARPAVSAACADTAVPSDSQPPQPSRMTRGRDDRPDVVGSQRDRSKAWAPASLIRQDPYVDQFAQVRPRLWTSLRVCVALVAAAMMLSGCTPNIDGITGITRDDRGQLIGLWQGCKERQTAAALTQDAFTAGAVHVGQWVPLSPSLANSFSLQPAPAPKGWSTWQPGPLTFAPGHVYSLGAWVELNETNAMAVEFTAEDLATLVPGRVLVDSREAEERLLTRDQFDNAGCKYSTSN